MAFAGADRGFLARKLHHVRGRKDPLAEVAQTAEVLPQVGAHVRIERDAHTGRAGPADRGDQRSPALGKDVARRPEMKPSRSRDRRPPHVFAPDELVGAMRPARREEGAIAPAVEGDEPHARARVAGETEARLDAFRPQFPIEQAPELVVSDDAAESSPQAEARDAYRDVGRRSARVRLEPLAVAEPPAPIGKEIHQRLAEAENVELRHSPMTNRAMSGT